MKKKNLFCMLVAGMMSLTSFSSCSVVENSVSRYVAPDQNDYVATVNSLVATDALGRSFGESSVSTDKKEVGMFYWVWHGQHTNGIYNIAELMESNPDTLWSIMPSTISPVNEMYYWNEPLYGYYASNDPWVIQRHLELLTMSGIDYLALDLTNIGLYIDTICALAERIVALQQQGWKPPRIMCIFNVGDEDARRVVESERITQLYEDLYMAHPEYADAWYCRDGKPVIAIDMFDDYPKLSQEIKDYFYFRNTLWSGGAVTLETEYDDMRWLDIDYPQNLYNGNMMGVSVAQHPMGNFGKSVNPIWNGEYYNSSRGRGWSYATGRNVAENVQRGTNIEGQWDTVLKNKNVSEVFVTGWNEWIAAKSIIDNQVLFIDTVTQEFSRDLEMMKGGYGDNFYLQNMRNVREFKGEKVEGYVGAKGTPSLDGVFTDARKYLDITGDAMKRDFRSTDGSFNYVNNTNRNDIESLEVMHDDNYLYLRVTTKEDIVVDPKTTNNLNILLSVDGLKTSAWEGYHFILNRTAPTQGWGTTKLEKVSESGKFKFENISDCSTYMSGKIFTVQIALADLGIDGAFTVDLKVADGMSNPSLMDSYYVDGDCAPIGRLNYRYNSTSK